MGKEVIKRDYWTCDRCKIDSETKGRMVPCPRGSCDAEITGEVTITKEIVKFDKPLENVERFFCKQELSMSSMFRVTCTEQCEECRNSENSSYSDTEGHDGAMC